MLTEITPKYGENITTSIEDGIKEKIDKAKDESEKALKDAMLHAEIARKLANGEYKDNTQEQVLEVEYKGAKFKIPYPKRNPDITLGKAEIKLKKKALVENRKIAIEGLRTSLSMTRDLGKQSKGFRDDAAKVRQEYYDRLKEGFKEEQAFMKSLWSRGEKYADEAIRISHSATESSEKGNNYLKQLADYIKTDDTYNQLLTKS